jgi:hypothetical protein
LAALLWFAWLGTASADDTHYRAIPIGAHAVGLGGAFTGVADDVSSAYFNPAGLSLGGTVGIAAGLTINAWERRDFRRAFEQPDSGAVTATTKTSRTVPIFVGAVVKFGPKLRDAERRYALGISVVEPIFSTGGVQLKLRGVPEALSDSYRASQSDRATWYGLSFASKLTRKHSLGATLYLSVRRLGHDETGILLSGGTENPDFPSSFDGTSTAANTQNLNFKAYHFVFRFGWLYQAKPQLRLGAMLQLPGIPLRQRVDVFSQGFVNDNRDPSTPPVTAAYFLDQKANANLPIPAEIELGLQYWASENVMLAVDASFHAPVRSGSRVKTDAQVPLGGVFFDVDTARTAAGNVAIAGDFFIGRIASLSAGFFTDISSALPIPENPERYYDARIHRFGGTLSVGVNVAGVALAVGSTVIYGKGDATGVVLEPGAFNAEYIRSEATSRIVYLHLTGATRAAEDVSKKAAERIKARQARRNAEKGGDDAEP